jgi:hypothetical protein
VVIPRGNLNRGQAGRGVKCTLIRTGRHPREKAEVAAGGAGQITAVALLFKERLHQVVPATTHRGAPGLVQRGAGVVAGEVAAIPSTGFTGLAAHVSDLAELAVSFLDDTVSADAVAGAILQIEVTEIVTCQGPAVITEALAGGTIELGSVARLAVGPLDGVVAAPAEIPAALEVVQAVELPAGEGAAVPSQTLAGLPVEVFAFAVLKAMND